MRALDRAALETQRDKLDPATFGFVHGPKAPCLLHTPVQKGAPERAGVGDPETLLNTYGDGMQRAVGRYGRDADKGGLAATHHGWVGGSSLVFCLRFGSPVVVAFPRMQ